MAKGKVCLVLIESKQIRGEKVLAGTVLVEGALAGSFSLADVSNALRLGQTQVEIRRQKEELGQVEK